MTMNSTNLRCPRVPREATFLTFYHDTVQQCVADPRYAHMLRCDTIERGRKILNTPEEVDVYIVKYGGHHYYKLIGAYRAIDFHKLADQPCDVIDWGCGRALATHVLLDYLALNHIDLKIGRILLIEPSEVALTTGRYHIGEISDAPTYTFQTVIAKANITASLAASSRPKIHLFSNILDIPGVNLNAIADIIHNTCPGTNYLVCVGPNYSNGCTRLDHFCNAVQRGCKAELLGHSERPVTATLYNLIHHKYIKMKVKRYYKVLRVVVPAPPPRGLRNVRTV